MDRRTFIVAMVAETIAAPLGAREKGATAIRRIGVLGSGAEPTPAELLQAYAPLRELGWVEGQNLLVERRYANGRAELLRPFAEDLVRLKVELIATNGTDATLAAKNATTTIPIVIWSAGDPVRTGVVTSLARPGGNITGYSSVSVELDAKRLALLRELLPTVQRVGVLENPTNPIFSVKNKENEPLYRSLGMQTIIVEVATAGELENAVAEMARRRAQVMAVFAYSLFRVDRNLIMGAALKHALPTLVEGGDMLEAGGLLSYTVSLAELNQRHAAFIDKILRGAKPADLPIEQPTKFELGMNLKTAKALGIAIPQSLLLRADVVIQ
jgi:putative ABC transport system substrate-binding protein